MKKQTEISTPKPMQWSPGLVARFWDFEATRPEFYFTYQFGQRIIKKLNSYINGPEVLDYGCGTGYLIKHLLKAGYAVTGSDQSPESLTHVNKHYNNLPNFFGAHTFGQLVQDGKKFNSVLCIEVVEHLDDAILETVTRELKGLLKSDGRLIITTPNSENLKLSEVYCPCCNHTFHRWQHVRSWKPDTLQEYFESAGFMTERVFATNLAIRPTTRIVQGLLRVLRRLLGHSPEGQPHLVGIFKIETT